MGTPSRGIGEIILALAVSIICYVEAHNHSTVLFSSYHESVETRRAGRPQFFTAGISGNNLLYAILSSVINQADTNANPRNDSFLLTKNLPKKFALVTSGPTRVLQELSPDSPILGMANRGKYYPLIKAGNSWCTIVFNGREGWIERQYIDIVSAPSSSRVIIGDLIDTTSIIGAICLLLFLIFFVASRSNKMKKELFSPTKTSITIIIVSGTETRVQRQLTNTTTSLKKCFTEIGFEVINAHDSDSTMKCISHSIPNALVVDWQLATNIQEVIEQMLVSLSLSRTIFVLFYNTPNPAGIVRSAVLSKSSYLGISFTDRDLFNVITPIIITGGKQSEIQKSIEKTALKGDIHDSKLSDVFQFIEIGHKSGCLLIEIEKPIGIVYFNDGIIIFAATLHSAGKKAVFEILNFQEGQFYFVLDRQPKSSNCTIPVIAILMEWTQKTDETSGNRLRQT